MTLATSPIEEMPVRAGDPRDVAIPRLVEMLGGRIYNLALHFCGNAAQAEDVVQETFLQAYRKWEQFKGDSAPGTWLYTIAARLCRRMHRRKSGQPRHMMSLSAAMPSTGKVPDLPGPEKDNPLRVQLRQEAIEHLERAIVELPLPFRMPLVLKDIVGFSVLQVGQIMRLKEATVKTRLHRARLLIRSAMDDHLPTKDAPPPAYTKQVCMDLLRAKQEALDHGVKFELPQDDYCERCSAVFESMDFAADACQMLGAGPLPARVRSALERELEAEMSRSKPQ
ncbi:MAG: RNA polymerase sigma factor [Phycisphaeraceae bacterium]